MKTGVLLSPGDAPEVFDHVLSLRREIAFSGTGFMQSNGGPTSLRVHVDLPGRSWRLEEEDGEVFAEHRDGVTTAPDGAVQAAIDESLPFLPLKFVFLHRLPVWGRKRDDYRPILVESAGGEDLLITFAHLEDPATRGTVVVDAALGIVTQLIRPTDMARLTVDP
ncbi:hypothetical protein [Agromyces humi]|uniref:hypothetical protein n=1 Tax=Agromyces humi TaxID=1766800 RepID=UPI001358EAED|nr:hypothetical protein [Agromyces humi]